MSDFLTAVLALTDSTLVRWLAFTAIITALAAWTIRRVLHWADEEVERHVQAALATEAADWSEPTRAQIEWEMSIADALALCETPIYAALSREQFIADALDEIAEMTGGVA